MALHQVDLLDGDALVLLVHRQHAPGPALLVAADHLHRVAPADLDRHQMTSGASEMIFMNAFSRSSRATGPKMRVPRGSLSSLISTTAFSSKRMYEPSLRRPSFTARTTTAFATSPFLTPAPGIASLIATTTMSPRRPYRSWCPPSTVMHSARFAPEVSATVTM